MTEKQIEKIKLRIRKYKNALAADKRKWGGYYHDGSGIRYVIPAEYIKINDFEGGLKYLKWFDKNFPDDIGHPFFLFESTFILFKNNKLKEAEKKLYTTYFSNIYLIDNFLGKEPKLIDKYESSTWESINILDKFTYSQTNPQFNEFTIWVESILESNDFQEKLSEYININKLLLTEPVGEQRSKLVERLSKL